MFDFGCFMGHIIALKRASGMGCARKIERESKLRRRRVNCRFRLVELIGISIPSIKHGRQIGFLTTLDCGVDLLSKRGISKSLSKIVDEGTKIDIGISEYSTSRRGHGNFLEFTSYPMMLLNRIFNPDSNVGVMMVSRKSKTSRGH